MKVWIHLNGVQEGPYQFEELPLDRMDANTPVWYEGLPDWQPAGTAPLTAQLFAGQEVTMDTAQSYNVASQEPGKPKCPPSFLPWSIAFTVVCCNPVGIIPIITGSSTRSKWNSGNYPAARRMSRVTEWWVMITIVTSLILAPLTLLMRL